MGRTPSQALLSIGTGAVTVLLRALAGRSNMTYAVERTKVGFDDLLRIHSLQDYTTSCQSNGDENAKQMDHNVNEGLIFKNKKRSSLSCPPAHCPFIVQNVIENSYQN